MKNFTCGYLKENGNWDDECPSKEIVATTVEEAAHIFAEQHPSDNPKIGVNWGLAGAQVVDNPEYEVQQEAAAAARRQEETAAAAAARRQEETAAAAAAAARVESLQKLHSSVESADGNLAGLSYVELSALVENLKDFPVMRDKISPEECAVREELYKVAFFDRNLQAALQTEQAALQTEQAGLQTSLLNQIASGQPTAGAAGPGKSNFLRNAAMFAPIAALHKLNQIEENTGDVSEGLGFD